MRRAIAIVLSLAVIGIALSACTDGSMNAQGSSSTSAESTANLDADLQQLDQGLAELDTLDSQLTYNDTNLS